MIARNLTALARSRRLGLLAGSATAVLIALTAGPGTARAQCAPDASLGGTAILCGGTTPSLNAAGASTVTVDAGATLGGTAAAPLVVPDAFTNVIVKGSVDGTQVSSNSTIAFTNGGSTLDVRAGGQVIAAGGDAVNASNASYYYYRSLTISNAGLIQSGGTAINGNTYGVLDVANLAGGRIEGATAIRTTGYGYGFNLTNAGAIVATGSYAVDADYISDFRNSVTGTIVGQVHALGAAYYFTNEGRIDGGNLGAVSLNGSFNFTNTGTLTSASTTQATVDLPFSYTTVQNSGIIANTGGGIAINSGLINNRVGGVISTTGPTAILAPNNATLENAGTIVGDVRLPGPSYYSTTGSIVRQRGLIQGSVVFGPSADTFLIDADTIASGTGVTGVIDGGGGTDLFGLTSAQTRTVSAPTLPAGFARLALEATSNDATLTLAGPVAVNVPIVTLGIGRVVIQSDLTTTGAFALLNNGGQVTTQGTINFVGTPQTPYYYASPTRGAALQLGTTDFGGGFVNAGTINVAGNASAVLSGGYYPQLTNSATGTINVRDGAVVLGQSYNPVNPLAFRNLGTITLATADASFQEAGALANLGLDNQGTISAIGTAIGGNASVAVGQILNSGTITSQTGFAIDTRVPAPFYYYYTPTLQIVNGATGLLHGGAGAITSNVNRADITNAGRIEGDVVLGGTGNVFRQRGGTLVGNLSLGDGDTLEIDAYAPVGITGTINPGTGVSTLSLVASTSGTVDRVDRPGGFSLTQLVVNGPAYSGERIAVTNALALDVTRTSAPPYPEGNSAAIVVRGFADLTNTAALGATGTFASAIQVRSDGFGYDPSGPAAINTGTITVAGGAAGLEVVGAGAITNAGAVTGDGTGFLVTNGGATLTNTGNISVTGAAVSFPATYGYGQISVVNTGILASTASAAIAIGKGPYAYYGGQFSLENGLGGIVTGTAGTAIDLPGANTSRITNAGTINGDVNLRGSYVAYTQAGGVINGRLQFGNGANTLILSQGFGQTIATGGITVAPSTYYGPSTVQATIARSQTAALDAFPGFQIFALNLIGVDTVATIAATPGPLDAGVYVSGEGLLVNQANLARTNQSILRSTSLNGTGFSGTIRNEGTLSVTSTNSYYYYPVSVGISVNQSAKAINAGVIDARGAGASGIYAIDGAQITNQGLINADAGAIGLLLQQYYASAQSGTNSGTIRTSNGATGVQIDAYYYSGAFTNSGTIAGDGTGVRVAQGTATVTNTGAIGGNNGIAIGSNAQAIITNASGATITGSGGAAILAEASPYSGQTSFARLALINQGAIVGDVDLRQSRANQVVVLDGGTIDGNLSFGVGDDRLVLASLDAALPISGTIDGGEGRDLVTATASGTQTVTLGRIFAGFEGVAVRADTGATVTLVGTAPITQGVALEGGGAFTQTADINVTDTVALSLGPDNLGGTLGVPAFASTTPGTLTNSGRLSATSTSTGGAGATGLLLTFGDATNSSTISASGAGAVGVAVEASPLNFDPAFFTFPTFTNDAGGTVQAADGAVAVAIISGVVVNAGTITGSNADAVVFGPSLYSFGRLENSGTIAGAGAAVSVTGSVALILSSGQIVSTVGTAITARSSPEIYSTGLYIENSSDGTISGQAVAIDTTVGRYSTFLYNQGTINGDVLLGGYGYNRVTIDGGTITGNLTLGGDNDTLLVRLGQGAGVTGTISATGANAAYGIFTDTTASIALAPAAGFEAVAAEARGADTVLTLLPGGGAEDRPLRLFGDGQIVVQQSITLAPDNDVYALDASNAGLARLRVDGTITAPNAIYASTTRFENFATVTGGVFLFGLLDGNTVLNKGTVSFTDAGDYGPALTALRVNVFDNQGTITSAGYNAVFLDSAGGDMTVSNSGRIETAGAGIALAVNASSGYYYAVPGRVDLINSGTIRSTGAGTVDYDGTASAVALSAGPGTIINSATGLIEATGALSTAVRLTPFSGYSQPGGPTLAPIAVTLINAGTINGGAGALPSTEAPPYTPPTAIEGGYGQVTILNSGTITGSVRLGGTIDRLQNQGQITGKVFLVGSDETYISDGGKLSGDLFFGYGGNVLLVRDSAQTGITGTITTSGTRNAFGLIVDQTTSAQLPTLAGFQEAAVDVRGAQTVLTLLGGGPTERFPLTVFGDGQLVVEQAVGSSSAAYEFVIGIEVRSPSLAALTLNADVTGLLGVIGAVQSFTNNATVTGQASGVVLTPRAGDAVTVVDTGSILAGTPDGRYASRALSIYDGSGPLAITNSGTIRGEYSGVLTSGSMGPVSLINTGLIQADGLNDRAVSLIQFPQDTPGPVALVDIVNSGTIRSTGDGTIVAQGGGAGSEVSQAVFFGPGTLTNSASGLIETTGTGGAIAVHFASNYVGTPCQTCRDEYQAVTFVNAGTVRGPDGFITFANAGDAYDIVSGAIFGRFGDYRVINTGLIQGSIYLGTGDTVLENRGIINGDIQLGNGANRVFEALNVANSGTITAGAGYNTLVLDGASGAPYVASRYNGFARLRTQGGGLFDLGGGTLPDLEIGGVAVTVSANANAGTLLLDGGTLRLAPGVTVIAPGGVAGTANGSTLIVEGTLQGAVALGAGDDIARFLNGGSASGTVDGGGGSNTLELGLLADATYDPAHYLSFQHLITSGPGVLGFGTDASFSDLALNGGGVSVASGTTLTAGQVIGGSQPTMLRIDGTLVAPVTLGGGGNIVILNGSIGGDLVLGGGGNSLSLGSGAVLGGKASGSGADTLTIALGADRTIDGGLVTGFSTLAADGPATLTLTGASQTYQALGVTGGNLTVQTLLTAPVTLSGGNQTLTLIGNLAGTANASGAGNTLVLDQLAGTTRALAPARFSGFQTLRATGAGLLLVDQSASFNQVGFAGDLTVALGATLTAPTLTGTDAAHRVEIDGTLIGALQFGAGNDTLILAGTLTGSADGGGGRNTANLLGSSALTLGQTTLSNFQTINAAGTLTIAADRTFSALTIGGGLIVNPGVTLTAPVTSGDAPTMVDLEGRLIGDVALGNGGNLVTVNGALLGSLALGGGDDSLSVGPAGTISGTVDGGAGRDTLSLALAQDTVFDPAHYRDFELLNTNGPSTLAIEASTAFTQATIGGSLRVGPLATLTVPTLAFTRGGATFDLAGQFIGRAQALGDGHLVLEQVGTRQLGAGQFTGFSTLETRGAGQLQITGDVGFASVLVGGGLRIDAGTTLTGAVNTTDAPHAVAVYGTLAGSLQFGGGNDTLTLGADGRITGGANGGAGVNGLVLDAIRDFSFTGNGLTGFQTLTTTGAGIVTIAGASAYQAITVNGAGLTVANGSTLAGPVTGSDQALALNVAGTLDGPVTLGNGNDRVTVSGLITGPLVLGSGSNVLALNGTGDIAGGARAGSGVNTLQLGLTAGRTLDGGRFSGFRQLTLTGPATLTLTGASTYGSTTIDGASLILAPGATLTSAVTATTPTRLSIGGTLIGSAALSGGASQVDVSGTVTGDLLFSGGGNLLSLAGGTIGGRIDGGAGTNRLELMLARDTNLARITGFTTLTATGARLLTIADTQSYMTATVAGDLTIAPGALLTVPALGFGAGDHRFTIAGDFAGVATGGTGTNTLVLDQQPGVTRVLAPQRFVGFQQLVTTGAGQLNIDRSASFAGVSVGGDLAVASGATLSAPVTGGPGNHVYMVAGQIAGTLALGAGDDRLIAFSATPVTGVSDGGMGRNSLEFRAPAALAQRFAGENFVRFQTLTVTSGQLNFGGRLTGLASARIAPGASLLGETGSTFDAAQVTVDAGGTFGSAGTVNGNIAVAGTLTPGTTPAIMRVNGSTAFAGGSTLALTLAPTGTSQILTTGAVTIAGGATLALGGTRQVAPATTLDLLIAGGGVSGSFTTLVQNAGVPGYVRTLADRIQLLGLFAQPAAPVGQSAAAITYVNGVLTAGQPGPALAAALPTLATAAGATRAAAFNQLTSEAYASAEQIGLEHGLLLVDAARAHAATVPAGGTPRFSSFAQGLGGWRSFKASAARGTGQADVETQGVIGGIEFGDERIGVGAFIGYLDSTQSIGAIDARTRASGILGGAFAHAAFAGIHATALVAYDGADAKTTRVTPDGTATSDRYRTGGLIADARLAYAIGLGGGIALEPHIGASYIEAQRGAVGESGSVYALSVEQRRFEHVYGDAGLSLTGSFGREALHFAPYLSAGVRYAFDAPRANALAGFSGTSLPGFTALGAERGRTSATIGAGAGVDVARGVRLFGSYLGEFAGESTRNGVTGGVSIRF